MMIIMLRRRAHCVIMWISHCVCMKTIFCPISLNIPPRTKRRIEVESTDRVDETVPGVHLTDGDMDQGHYKDDTPSPQTHLALDTTWIVAAEAAVDGAAKPQLAVIHVQGRTR